MTRYADAAAPGDWLYDAQCYGEESLALTSYEEREAKPTKRVLRLIATYCDPCPVRAECRAWALTTPDPAIGFIAGGMTPRMRSQERRRVSDPVPQATANVGSPSASRPPHRANGRGAERPQGGH